MSTAPQVPSPSPAAAESTPVRFGLIGSGFIARWFMEAVAAVPQARAVAVTSAHPERAAAFASEHGIGASYATLPEMLEAGREGGANPVDVVYVGSPNSLHAEQTVAALEAGFHVLVEKPFALRPEEARRMIDAARAHDRFLMEAWLPAFEPGIAALRSAIAERSGGRSAAGEGPHRAVLVKEQFSSRMTRYRAGELPPAFNPALGGGSLMDLGVYPVSLAVHLFGAPDRVTATGRLLDSGADSHGAVVLDYAAAPDGSASGLEVVCLHSKTSPAGSGSSVSWDREAVWLDDCQLPRRLELRGPDGAAPLPLEVPEAPVLARELAEVCRLVASGARESELHPLSESLATVEVLTAARAQAGIVLPGDEDARMGA